MDNQPTLTNRIAFHSEGISFVLPHPDKIRTWISQVINNKGYQLEQLNFIFCDDAYLHKINVEYLNHDTYTDIITFPYSEGRIVESDLFISVERTNENAQTYGVEPLEELYRVMVHGVLHLLGYGDKTEAEKAEMRKQENVCLKQLTI